MKPISIMIVDDHPIMREALRTALAEEPGFQVVCDASDGMEAVERAQEYSPDVILMDLLMRGMDGLEAINRIIENNPQARVMVVTSLEDEEKILAAIQAGALGYFPKTAPRSYLLEAIRKVADGVPYLPTGIAQKLFHGLRTMKKSVPQSGDGAKALTTRQEEILALIGEGHSDDEIGKTLSLSDATVRSHVHNIMVRLGLESRGQLVAFANDKR
jgi:NarL family two-component system response regulator LiaR